MMSEAASAAAVEGDSALLPDQRVQILGQISGSLLHEFNNILPVITGTIDMLAESVADRPELSGVVKLIDDAAFRGARLTSQLLGFDRGRPSRPCETDINVLVGDAVRLLRPLLGRRIEVSADPDSEPLLGMVDPGLLLIALLSLGCAVRACVPEGSRIHIGVSSASAAAEAGGRPDRTPDVIVKVAFRYPFQAPLVLGNLRLAEQLLRQTGGLLSIPSHADNASLIEIRLPGMHG